MSAILPARIAAIAKSKIGLKESPSGSNKGPQIQEFFAADDYDPNGKQPGDSGYPWCAAFVDRVVQLAMEGREWTFKRPVTPSAWGLIQWSRDQDESTHTIKNPGMDIERGDIVVFVFSHVGIAAGPPDAQGNIPTIEGNTNVAGEREGTVVMAKRRHISSVKAAIRFTV